MAKAKYVIIVILIVVCVFLTWYVFVRENVEIVEYMDKFNNATEVVQGNVDNEPDDLPPDSDLPPDGDLPPDNTNIGGEVVQKPDTEPTIDSNQGSVILTSETEMLNKQGEELLKQISKELENSILTIKQSTGVVDDDILNKEQDL